MSNIHLLQQLASNHHSSDYNRAKFGTNGSPIQYLPMSLHLPEKFNQLRTRQLLSAERQSWWPAAQAKLNLQDEIMAAISTSLFQSSQLLPAPTIKTSCTHPISVSFMVPPELRIIISSHALLAPPLSPTLLEIPPSFTLLRLSNVHTAHLQSSTQQHLPVSNAFQTRNDLAEAIKAAIGTHMPQNNSNDLKPPSFSGVIPDASVSYALSLATVPNPIPLHNTPLYSFLSSQPAPSDPTNSRSGASIPQHHNVFSNPSANALTIGNLYLSSCPGKKVRLEGPVNGRSGIYRNLEVDMARMKRLGVSCIVCCLDDDELEFLGAPWPEYEQCANRIKIDVLRLPTPDGLPPVSAPHLDGYLVDLINRYTLCGQSILVHCRGGVGRAGVVACCWMIRLGLCGWSEHFPSTTTAVAPESTLSFVTAVIALVRKRRSKKAIETYEQVKFLVEYVEHLRESLSYAGLNFL